MAAQAPTAQSIDSPSWEIDKDAFAPPATRRIIRAWDRAQVSAHAPRLLGRKIWKQVALKPMKAEPSDCEVQAELEKDGTGARKKARMIGMKENIGNALWDVTVLIGSDLDKPLGLEMENDEGSIAMVTEDKASYTPQKYPNSSELQFVPRKRTNTNHVITPKKPMRQTSLSLLALGIPYVEHTLGNLNSPRQRRKSSGKGIRRSFDKIALGMQGVGASSQPLGDLDHAKGNGNEVRLVNESEVNVATTERKNLRRSTRRSGACSVDIQGAFDTISSTSNETLAGTSVTTTSKIKLFSSQDVVEDTSTEIDYNELACPSHPETTTFTTSDAMPISKREESKTNGPDSTLSNKSTSLESGDLGSPSISGSDICAGKSIQDIEIASGPVTIVQDDQSKRELDVTLTVGDPAVLTSDQSRLLRDDSPIDQMFIIKLPDDGVTAARADASLTATNESGIFSAATPQPEVYGMPNDLEELVVPEKESTDMEELETSDLKTNELADTNSANTNTILHNYDHDDTDMLRRFLTRVKANKAAKKAPTKRKRSLPHSPLRIPLGEMDENLSPSMEPADSSDLTQLPSRSKRCPLVTEEEVPEARSIRRSGRTRPPTKAIPSAPSFIPVRRLGQEAETTVTLKRNEEKEIAALTRVNTRKNKGAALTAAEVLAQKSEEKEDPVMRQRLLKEVFNEKKEKDKRVGEQKSRGKSVTWAEELAQFQTLDKSKLESAKSDKEKEKNGQAEEEKTQGAVRVSVRSKMALGMAVNGTPAPKRKMRGQV